LAQELVYVIYIEPTPFEFTAWGALPG